jgi:ATP-dependent Zn protease
LVPEQSGSNLRVPITLGRRLRVIGTVIAVLSVVAWKHVGEGNAMIDAWALASQEWMLLVWIAMLDVVRQGHYALGETSPTWWRVTLRAEARLEAVRQTLHPWTRFLIARCAKTLLVGALVCAWLSKSWNVSILSVPGQLPTYVWSVLWSSRQNLPMILQVLLLLGLSVMQFVAIFWFMSRGGVEELAPGDVKTRFRDVWGQDHVLERVRENIVFLQQPETIESRGGHVPGGILLWGPPGTGKTLMAEAIAGETNRPYVFVDPGAFQAMFFGVGIMKVKRLFKRLRRLALRHGGVVVFFDEADSLGNRTGMRTSRVERAVTGHERWMSPVSRSAIEDERDVHDLRRTSRVVMGFGGTGELQILLSELSGLTKPRGFWGKTVRNLVGMRPKPAEKYRILSIFATNLPDVLDPALLRPGRIDRQYHVSYPNLEGRIATYQGYFKKTQHNLTEEQLKKLAVSTPYATGASIKDLVNESIVRAVRRSSETVTWDDVQHARHSRELGEADSGEYIQRERYSVALHEACHAVCADEERRHMTVDVATIERRGAVGGLVGSIPPEDRFTHWSSEYQADLVVCLASIAGEEMFFSQHTSGVGGDLLQATKLAELMSGRWGMGTKLRSREKPADVSGDIGGSTSGSDPDEVEALLLQARDRARAILEDRRSDVLALCHALEAHRTLDGDDVEAVFQRRKGPHVDGAMYTDEVILELEKYHSEVRDAVRENRDVLIPWRAAF